MPAKKKTAAQKAPKKEKSFEESLWETATKLRGSVESSDWSGATETTRQGCPQGERGGAHQYFLGKFAASEGKLGGEWSGATSTTRQGCPEGERGGVHQFYTPKCVVNLIAEMIEPYKGKIYDPCCGSGGMFVQSLKFVESHHGNTKDISVYGQDKWAWGVHLRRAKRARRVRQRRKLPNQFTATTYKLAKMNLAVRGLSANLGDVPADTFFEDQHPDLKADYIMANPPFNLKDWRAADELVHDGRWNGYDTPPLASNLN
jgi:type I restriction enzyme M protein